MNLMTEKLEKQRLRRKAYEFLGAVLTLQKD